MSVALVTGVLAASASAAVCALVVPDPRRVARAVGILLALAAAAAAGLFAVVAAGTVVDGALGRPEVSGIPFTVGVRVDRFGALFVLLVCGIAAVVAGYARRYLDGEPGVAGFHARVAGATTATLVMATAPSLVQFAVGWVVAGWMLTGLIGYHRDEQRVRAAVRRVRAVFRLGDVALVSGFAVLAVDAGSADLSVVRAAADDAPAWVTTTAGGLLLVAGMVRSAQVPAHGWLPNTLDAPTPVSAFLHAGMVNVAGFLVVTLAPVVVAAPVVMTAMLLVGLTTAAVGTLFAAVRTDVKGTLARSTVAQMGFMLAQCGLGAFGLAAVHLVGHGVYKAYAFLSAGGAVQAQARAAHAPQPIGPVPVRRLVVAAVVVIACAGITEVLVGGGMTGVLSAVLAVAAALAALRAALADHRLGAGTVLAIAASVAGLASAYLVVGWAATGWMALPSVVTSERVAVTAAVLAALTLVLRTALRRRCVGLWWWAWRDGYASQVHRRITTRPPVMGPRGRARLDGKADPRARLGEIDACAVARAAAATAVAGDHVAAAWPLDTFVAVNPLAGLERTPFPQATARIRELGGVRTHLPVAEYRQRLHEGEISHCDLTDALAATLPATGSLLIGGRPIDVADLYLAVLVHPVHDGPSPPPELVGAADRRLADLAAFSGSDDVSTSTGDRTLSELLDDALGSRITADVDDLTAGWCAAHCGRPAAHWPVPGGEAQDCWSRWRQVAAADCGPALLGATGFADLVAALPATSEQALAALLHALGVPPDRWAAYLSRSLLRLPGWAGYARWSQTHPEQRPALTVGDVLAVRLAYELALGAAAAHRHLGLPPTVDALRAATGMIAPPRAGADPAALARLAAVLGLDAATLGGLPDPTLSTLRDTLLHLCPQRQEQIWLTAAEHAYRRQLRDLVDRGQHRQPHLRPAEAPLAQAVFCIDVRSEGLRRHLEAAGPVQTFGFAGFFGLPVRTVASGAHRGRDRCPVIMQPVTTVAETATATTPSSYATTEALPTDTIAGTRDAPHVVRRRSRQAWRRAYAGAKTSPAGAFAFVEVAGLLAATALLVRAAAPRWLSPAIDEPAPTAADLDSALTLDEQVYYAEAMLRTIGLTTDFAPLVLLCGHGATSTNNPYAAALDCGACGGNRGGVSARLAATILNKIQVRSALAARGVTIPERTYVLAAEHDTVTDEVRLLDCDTVPATHRHTVDNLTRHLADAGVRMRHERAKRLPGRPAPNRMRARAADWAQVRPEWGLAGNAAFIAAPRSLTAGLDLGCRTFLHSYDCSTDPDAGALETILTGPVVVATWINLQYYFSSVDPHRLGAGTKTVHTVLGDGLGVLAGTGGDLRTGLPWQSVSDGRRLAHQPLRLLALVRAPQTLVNTVLHRNPTLRQLVNGGWLSLTAIDPRTGQWSEFDTGAWRTIPAQAPPGKESPRRTTSSPAFRMTPVRPTYPAAEKEPTP